MRIIIKNGKDKNFHLRLPTGLFFNTVTASFMPYALQKQGISVTRQQAVAFVKALNAFRRSHRDWILAEVESADGAQVYVKL